MTHTPGPWAVTTSTGDVHAQGRSDQNWICQGPNPSPAAPPDNERSANARLIASAPDLLSALREAWDLLPARPPHDPVHCQYDKIRRAIAKATDTEPVT
jgi:hypothetical protein